MVDLSVIFVDHLFPPSQLHHPPRDVSLIAAIIYRAGIGAFFS